MFNSSKVLFFLDYLRETEDMLSYEPFLGNWRMKIFISGELVYEGFQ